MTSQLWRSEIHDVIVKKHGWFEKPGAYVLVDGQYGSTGKGLLAAVLGEVAGDMINVVTTNAGPNSGHTGYIEVGDDIEKVVTQQLPVLSVVSPAFHRFSSGWRQHTYLNGGAVIDNKILQDEVDKYQVRPFVHPNAAVITTADDADTLQAIASTGKGVGSAIARKVMRDPGAVMKYTGEVVAVPLLDFEYTWDRDVVFVETAQGFSLGINSEFYPYTTSRECTVMQALADARIPAQMLRKVIMTVRTYPIRVGNTDKGHSGGCYADQKEISWEELGVEPEITTVTKRVRRVFTWSRTQFRQALRANRPDGLFVNFLNYLDDEAVPTFIDLLQSDYELTLKKRPDFVLGGYGPYNRHVKVIFPGL